MMHLGSHRLLVLAPHPDDEVIGCGGLVSRIKEQGGKVFVQIVTVGDTTDASETGFSAADERDREIARVADLLDYDGHEVVFPGEAHHLRLDALPQRALIEAIEVAGECSIRAVHPTIVAIPDPASYNQDHRAVATAAMAALRPGDPRFRHQPAAALIYEQVGDQWNTGAAFTPNVYVGLEQSHLDAKLAAVEAYKSQARLHPNTRSSEALAAMAYYRGAQAGSERAEAYRALRWTL